MPLPNLKDRLSPLPCSWTTKPHEIVRGAGGPWPRQGSGREAGKRRAAASVRVLRGRQGTCPGEAVHECTDAVLTVMVSFKCAGRDGSSFFWPRTAAQGLARADREQLLGRGAWRRLKVGVRVGQLVATRRPEARGRGPLSVRGGAGSPWPASAPVTCLRSRVAPFPIRSRAVGQEGGRRPRHAGCHNSVRLCVPEHGLWLKPREDGLQHRHTHTQGHRGHLRPACTQCLGKQQP